MIKLKDLQIKKYGMLTVIGEAAKPNIFKDKRKHPRYLLCQCDCGKTHVVEMQRLKNSITKSCGCLKHASREKNHNWRGYGFISGTLFCNLKKNAEARKFTFELTIEFLHNLFLKQDKKCALSGLTLTLPENYHSRKGTASIDRIDSLKGYLSENVQWIHKDINRMKNNLDQNNFLKLCLEIARYNNSKLFSI